MTDTNGNSIVMPVAPMGGYGNGGFGSFGDMNGGWWIILLLLCLGGGWGNGFGGFGGNGAGFVGADVQRGFDQSAVVSGINGVQNAVNSGFGDVQTSLCSGFAGVNSNIASGFSQAEIGENARQMANMQQIFGLQSQLAQCCCDNRMATVQTQNIVQTEGAATRLAIQQQTQAILDKMCANEIEQLRTNNENLRQQLAMANLAASQTAQTQQIIAALTPTAAVASK